MMVDNALCTGQAAAAAKLNEGVTQNQNAPSLLKFITFNRNKTIVGAHSDSFMIILYVTC